MNNETAMVFGSWKIGESIGSGTDGRVSYIYQTDDRGNTRTSVLKTIFFSENRNETKDFNKVGSVRPNGHSSIEEIIEAVANNIDLIREVDNGKRFVKYEEYEVRKVKDGYVLYIRLEQMRSLENLLKQFSLTESEAIQIGVAICRSLIRTRKINYVYPYLKPENILFDEKGACKLGDFGSFSYLEPSKASIAYKKSECFMAPEFIETGRSNTTSDTYALGLILYMLTNRGRLPFAETYPQPLTAAGLERSKKMRLEGAPLPKPALATDELFAVIRKACAFSEKDRFLHPGQMLEALKGIGSGKPAEEMKYDEVYSNSAEPAPRQETPQRSSESVNEYLAGQGMPDQRNVVAAPPKALSFDDIMSQIESGADPSRAQAPSRNQAPQQRAQSPQPSQKKTADGGENEAEGERTSLKERIRVPNIRPRDYINAKRQAPEKPKSDSKVSRFFVRDLPQSKDDRKYNADLKRIIAIFAAIILVLVLILVSCTTRSKNKRESMETATQSSEQLVDQGTVSQINNNADAQNAGANEGGASQSEAGESGDSEAETEETPSAAIDNGADDTSENLNETFEEIDGIE